MIVNIKGMKVRLILKEIVTADRNCLPKSSVRRGTRGPAGGDYGDSIHADKNHGSQEKPKLCRRSSLGHTAAVPTATAGAESAQQPPSVTRGASGCAAPGSGAGKGQGRARSGSSGHLRTPRHRRACPCPCPCPCVCPTSHPCPCPCNRAHPARFPMVVPHPRP